MSSPLAAVIASCVSRINHHIAQHRRQPGVSFEEHVMQRRREKAARAMARQVIYLDTNAWKCAADCRRNKPSLTPAMRRFGETLERAAKTGRFAFPIGVPTYFEMDAMVEPGTQAVLEALVDELSQGLCISSYHDRTGVELQALQTNRLAETSSSEHFLCSPAEMMGISNLPVPALVKVLEDETTYRKAFFDALCELPFSVLLSVAKDAPGEGPMCELIH